MVEFLNYQYCDRDKVIQIAGEYGLRYRTLSPNDIVGNKDVVISIATDNEESPAVKRQQLIQFFTILQQMPPEMIDFHWKILDKMYKAFFPQGCLEDMYEPPPGVANVITPDEEFELILNGIQPTAKKGQDHQAAVASLTKDMHTTGLALSDEQVRMLQSIISQHEALYQQEQQAQMQQQMAAMAANAPQGGGGVNTGQAANMSPFTQKSGNASMPSLVRDARGGA